MKEKPRGATALQERPAGPHGADNALMPSCHLVTGTIVSIESDGQILVDFPGNSYGLLTARSTVKVGDGDVKKNVVLAFENADQRLPIVIGLIQDAPIASRREIHLDKQAVDDIRVDGRNIVLDAAKRVEIRCGQSSLIMQSDGKIIIKGNYIISRARQVNKVKGAAVKIN